MVNSGGYLHEGHWKEDAGGGQYIFAKKDGKEYFLKRFREPIYPKPDNSQEYKRNKIRECQEFEDNKKALIKALQKVASGGGNIVAPTEIFMDENHFIMVTYKVDTSSISMEKVASESVEKKLLLLRTMIMSMKRVHSIQVVHGDLKPENILISHTKGSNSKLVCKIIDFDDSYFSQNPPPPADTVGTEPYWSPELAAYKITDNEDFAQFVTCKSDIFALGLIFHQYLSNGRLPNLHGFSNAYQAVCAGEILKADTSIKPQFLQNIIERMLLLNPEERPSCEEIFKMLTEEAEQTEKRETKDIEKTIIKQDKWPRVERIERNPNKVKVTFEDGRVRILGTDIAEIMGWSVDE